MKKTWISLGIIIMWITAIKATIAVLTDSNPAHYNNLPMIVVYILLGLYLLTVLCVTARICSVIYKKCKLEFAKKIKR